VASETPQHHPFSVFLAVLAVAGLVFVFLFVTRTTDSSLLAQIQKEGKLVVITRNSATTYYEGPEGPTGFEYDLVSSFADELDVDLELVIPERFADIIPMIARGEAHLAAAGLTRTPAREELVEFGPGYQEITQQVVYRKGTTRPRRVQDLIGGTLEVVAGTSHVEALEVAFQEYPELRWREHFETESEEMLELVHEDLVDYTIADSNEVAISRRFFPELRVAFDLTEPQTLAWAFPKGEDESLINAAREFFERIESNGTLDQLKERYYGHIDRFDYQGVQTLLRHYAERFPAYGTWFREAARHYGLDWRLLAAMGYQESVWDEDAVSPTGVRGIMMLTQKTARLMDIKDRTDPKGSIWGGARWFVSNKARIPERIPEPDRTWLAMAAYNVGLGHLEDARILADQLGGDPDRWVDVKKTLPLLSKKKWYSQTRHGYARGWEPVQYVERIRGYYEILVWITDRENRGTTSPTESVNSDVFSILPPTL
jgi:membrane-bound lytic murein transglycosylase F